MKHLHEYSYTTRRMSMRDELVFKSIIRILHGQTQQDWHYESSNNADLMVLGPQLSLSNEDTLRSKYPIIIKVGCAASDENCLALPLRVGDVLVAINHAGELLSDLKHANGHPAGDNTDHRRPREATISLLRWPTWDVLQQDSRYLRVATVLATGPSTISSLSNKSGVPFEICDQLIQVLKFHELINTRIVTADAKASDAGGVASPLSAAIQAQKTSSAPSTLWHRIRQRLGMNIAHTNS